MIDSSLSEDGIREYITECVMILESKEKPRQFETWVYGLAMVTATAFAASIAILCTPLLSKRIYNRLLNFLVALGVGNLTGCTFFVLLPHAFHITKLGSADYVTKAWMTLGGCYLLFIFEKIIDFWIEIKKKKNIKSAIRVINAVEILILPQIDASSSASVQESIWPIVANDKSEAQVAVLSGWANNFIDGMTIGVTFADSPFRGLTVGLAILSQQFPDEVESLVIVMSTGVGLKRALLFNLVQAALSYIGFVIAVLIDDHVEQFDSYIYAVAAGNYLYICLGSRVPEMSDKVIEHIKVNTKEGMLTTILQFLGIVIGLVFMFLMALGGKDIALQNAECFREE